MTSPNFSSITEQVAAHLGAELRRGRWQGTMPGRNQLVEELGVSTRTVELAFELLEKEGLLVPQGAGRRRKIVLPEGGLETPPMRVAVLFYEKGDEAHDLVLRFQNKLVAAGHTVVRARKNLTEIGGNLRRLTRMIKDTDADAWVVCSASREVLEWFARQKTPAFALFGERSGLPIAATGPDKEPPLAEATRRLVALGHRRISFLCHRELRLPQPVPGVRVILDELEAAGIATGAFNLPDWEHGREDFERVLDSLFAATPPTALILDEPYVYHAGFHHLARRGLRVPEDVSLICTDPDPTFTWCQPPVAHIHWDYRPGVRRVIRWVNNTALGKDDRRQSFTKAEFVEGGTVGKAKKGR